MLVPKVKRAVLHFRWALKPPQDQYLVQVKDYKVRALKVKQYGKKPMHVQLEGRSKFVHAKEEMFYPLKGIMHAFITIVTIFSIIINSYYCLLIFLYS